LFYAQTHSFYAETHGLHGIFPQKHTNLTSEPSQFHARRVGLTVRILSDVTRYYRIGGTNRNLETTLAAVYLDTLSKRASDFEVMVWV
jgi:hypothetical protein